MRNDLQDMRHSIGSTLLSAQRSSKNGRREEGKKERIYDKREKDLTGNDGKALTIKNLLLL